MIQNIKLFRTQAIAEEFMDSAKYEEPHVSYVPNDEEPNLYYNKKVKDNVVEP